MALFNTQKKFGSLIRLCHWTTFTLFVLQFFLVYRREYFVDGAPEKLEYILLHKSIGAVLLLIAAVFFLLKPIGQRPPYPNNMTTFEQKLATGTHHLLWLLMFAMPITGIAMSLFSGYGVSVFGWFSLPQWVTPNKAIAGTFHQIHGWISYGVIGVVGLHILGALIHHFVRKDTVLKRML